MSGEPTTASLAERLVRLDPETRRRVLDGFSDGELAALYYDWAFWARPNQWPPDGDWYCWAVIAGRGFGKTHTGAQWVRRLVETASSARDLRIALVAETAADARDVMVEGESGILRLSPPEWRPLYEPSKHRLTWPNGAVAITYSADDPEQLRGPQHHFAWCDELAKYRHGAVVWSNLLMGLRLGRQPRVLVTTTPRPIQILKDILAGPGTVVTRGGTFENATFLPPAFKDQILRRYGGTRIGRQELDAEILEDVPGALWSRALIEESRTSAVPALNRVVVAIDPPASRNGTCGIMVAGIAEDGTGYVLEDASKEKGSPLDWGKAAVDAYHAFEADRVVAEVNQGGDMVETVIRQVDPAVPVRTVRARRGKAVRAEPVAALYEQGRVRHVGAFPDLEDQLCRLGADMGPLEPGADAQGSPDRADALVWALTDLMLGPSVEPSIRPLV